MQDVFDKKYTASFSTSIHFFDYTAHNYIQGICEDLGMHFVRSFSAEMQDLMDAQERQNLKDFMENVIYAFKNKVHTSRVFPKLKQTELKYKSDDIVEDVADSDNIKLVILTDTASMSDNLQNMVKRFQANFSKEPEIIDLTRIKIAGGCLGCVKCGMDNECVYDGKDDVRSVYEDKLKKADIIVFALTMKDRYFSSRWKNFLDRSFYKTHQPAFPGKQIGYLISGPLLYEPNLRQILLASAELGQANLVDIITDECDSSAELDGSITCFAQKLTRYSKMNVSQPETCLGVGAGKIFRDEIWGNLRFIFQADYRYYKNNGMMDFPQSKINTRIMHPFIPLMKLNPIKKQVQDRAKDMMHRSHDLIIKKEEDKLKEERSAKQNS